MGFEVRGKLKGLERKSSDFDERERKGFERTRRGVVLLLLLLVEEVEEKWVARFRSIF
jgi:hypothetical protein